MERCPNCGASIRTGARFCTACGNRISQPAVPPVAVDAPQAPVATDAPVWSAAPAEAQPDQSPLDSETVPEMSAPSHPVMADQPADGSATAEGWSDVAAHSDERAPDVVAASARETLVPEASAPGEATRVEASTTPQRDDRYGWSTWSPTQDDAPTRVVPSSHDESGQVDDGADRSSVIAGETPEAQHAAGARVDENIESSSATAGGTEDTSADAASTAPDVPKDTDHDQDVIALPGPDAEVGPVGVVTDVAEEPVQSVGDDDADDVHSGIDAGGSATTTDEVVYSDSIQDDPVGQSPHDPVIDDVVLDESVIRTDGLPVAEEADEVPTGSADPDGSGPGADNDWEPWGQASDPDPTTDSSGLNQPDADPTWGISADADSGAAVSDWSAGLWSVDGPDAGVATPAATGTAQSSGDPLGQVRRLVEELRVALDAASETEPGHGAAGGATASDVLQLLDGMPSDPVDLDEIETLRDEAAALEDRDFDIRALQQFAHRRMLIGDLVTAYLQQRDLLQQLRATVSPPDAPAPSN